MKVADATDMPDLILCFFPRIAAIFDPFNPFGVVFIAPCGQKPSLTMPRNLPDLNGARLCRRPAAAFWTRCGWRCAPSRAP